MADKPRSITVHSSRLIEAVNLVKHAAALNPARPALQTLMIEGDDKGLRLVAADNYRIAIADLSEEASEFGRVLIWTRDIPLILSIVRAHKGTVEFTVAADQLTVAAGSFTLTLRLCDATFPDYRREEFPWTGEGRMALGINPKYLAESLAALSKTTGVVRVYPGTDPEHPILVAADGYTEIIMPLRLAQVYRDAA